MNRSRFYAWGMLPAVVLSLAVFMGLAAEPSKTPAIPQDECTKLLDKIKAIEEELVTIREHKPPFDKMDQAEINDNIAYRIKEINLHKSRRYALGCPGAEAVVLADNAAAGGTGSGGLSAAGGAAPGTLESAGLTLKEYAETISGARYVQDDPQTCLLPGDGAALTVGTPAKARFNPGNLADAEFTSEVIINGLKARAGSVGEDMQGYWGAVISWNLNGLTYTVEISGPYPEMKDDTPEKRQELYEKCLRRAMEAALPYDKAMRKQK
ncbi:MAG: hypothetical protein ACYDH3_00930 [Candidatus Aminicenantales bacterium]